MTLANFLDECYVLWLVHFLMYVNMLLRVKTCFCVLKPACACSNMHKLLAYYKSSSSNMAEDLRDHQESNE